LQASATKYGKSEYGRHLQRVADGKILYGDNGHSRPHWGYDHAIIEAGRYD